MTPMRLVSLPVFTGLLLPILCGNGLAQSAKDAYVQDVRGFVVRSTPFGDARAGNLCWRTGYWSPALSIAECDPDIAPRVAGALPDSVLAVLILPCLSAASSPGPIDCLDEKPLSMTASVAPRH